MHRFWSSILFVFFLGATGCQTIRSKISNSTEEEVSKEQEIATIKADFSQKLDVKTKELTAAHLTQLSTIDSQLAAVAGSFYAQDLLYQSIPSPIRRDIVMHMIGEEGWAALSHRLPTYETMQKINQRIRDDLDETKTSLGQLKSKHEMQIGENAKLADAAKVAADHATQLQRDLDTLKVDHNIKLAELERQKSELTAARADLERQRSDNAAATRAAKLKAIGVLGGLALLCVVGAVWSPVFKDKFALMAAVLALVAALVWYFQAWHAFVALGVGALVLLGRMLYLHHASDKTVSALTGYLHDKGQLAEADLQEWLTKYVKDRNGTITTAPDKAVQSLIDQKLMASDRK